MVFTNFTSEFKKDVSIEVPNRQTNNGNKLITIGASAGIVTSQVCGKNDFPELVNRDYLCKGKELNEEYTYSVDDKLVIGLLHEGKKCDTYDIDYINNNQITGPMCEARNSMPLDKLNFGMGDIFIRLAN